MNNIMTPSLRKFTLSAHIISSVGLLGSIASFLALAIAGLTSVEVPTVRAAYLAMELIAQFVIVPLAFASILTGLVQSLGTPWGLFRHYWVLAKFAITGFATGILLVKMALISHASRLAAETVFSVADLRAAGIELLVHAAAGLMVLLVPAVLSVYKPRGLTPFGKRKQLENQKPSQPSYSASGLSNAKSSGARVALPHPGSTVTIPRRAYIFGFVFVVVAVHLVILHLSGVQLGNH